MWQEDNGLGNLSDTTRAYCIGCSVDSTVYSMPVPSLGTWEVQMCRLASSEAKHMGIGSSQPDAITSSVTTQIAPHPGAGVLSDPCTVESPFPSVPTSHSSPYS